ncbi:MAG: zinc metalloprotease HtpX [Deltaproteobacteria bacterium]|nr:zinc metalloprotease HtpX [Deltaproteobacteria bacterium]MBW2020247.1 zinc metalloprotease HtpX [Deltaproteobacteria bacterium]MBW2075014.1 zinc metalloprotease HtpX [Deltaproteobacteria bacterium]RLB83410.1 MAG: zinc metalloprotease HtpX [Deltaproteobacteria bacterium]
MGNSIRTGVFLAALTVLVMIIGRLLGGTQGMVIAFFFAVIMNFGSYWFSDKIVLGIYRARPVSETEAPELHRIVRQLSRQAGLPMPKVCIMPSESPNAFATGRNPQHAVVAVTQGILRLLNEDELKGVIAHELAHVKHRDILIGSIAATLAGAIMMIANMARWAALFGGFGGRDEDDGDGGMIGLIAMSILAPIAAMLIQMAISRSREYAADAAGASFAGSPYGLASALQKISSASRQIPMKAEPATAHMFIMSPLSGRSLMNLFSTHPPVEERIRRLTDMR